MVGMFTQVERREGGREGQRGKRMPIHLRQSLYGLASFLLPSSSSSLFHIIPSHSYLLPSFPPSLTLSLLRHEMPTDPNDPLSHQNLKDRYYGVNDPVAEKLMSQASDMPMLSAPDDRSITSLYVGGVDVSITEKDLRSVTTHQECIRMGG